MFLAELYKYRTRRNELGMTIGGVFDILNLSRIKHGRKMPGGHSPPLLVEHKLGVLLGRTEQTCRWNRRPHTESRECYAALEVLVDLVGGAQ